MRRLPYIGLVVAGVLIVLFTWRPRPTPVQVGLLLFTGSGLDTADLVGFGLLRMYEYHPHLLRGKPDIYIGEMLAEVLFVPVLFSTVGLLPPPLRFAGGAALAILLAGIEYLFLSLGVFHYHGWAAWFTPILFFLFARLAATWVNAFERAGYTRLHRFIILLCATNLSWHALSLFLQRLLQRGWSNVALVANSEINQILGTILEYGLPYHLIALTLLWTVRKPTLLAAGLGGAAFAAWLRFLELSGIYQDGPVIIDGAALGIILWGLVRLDQWFAARTAVVHS